MMTRANFFQRNQSWNGAPVPNRRIANDTRGFISELLGFEGLGSFFELRTWLIAIAGAAVLLLLVRAVSHGNDSRNPLTH